MQLEKGMRVTLKQCGKKECKCHDPLFAEEFLGKPASITTMRGKNITVTMDELHMGILTRIVHVRKPTADSHITRVYQRPLKREH